MKKNVLISIFIFSFLILSINSINASVEPEDILPNMRVEWFTTLVLNNLSEYFTGADYYCFQFLYANEWWGGCNLPEDETSQHSNWYDERYNISIGYYNASGTEYRHALALKHDFNNSNGSHYESFSIFPVEIQAWDNEGNMVSQYITMDGEGVSQQLLPQPNIVPVRVSFISDITMEYGDALAFNINDYFVDYNHIKLEWYSPDWLTSGTITKSKQDLTQTCVGPHETGDIPVVICLEGQQTDIALSTYAEWENTTVNISITAYNDYGFIWDNFLINVVNVSYPDVENYYHDQQESASFIGYLSTLLNAIYPNSEILTLKERLSYVFVTIILIDLLIIFLLIKTGSSMYAGLIVTLLDLIALLFFTATSYIPAWLMVGFLIMSIAIITLKKQMGS